MGDLKSVVLHDMKINHVKSTFPMSLGARVTGVDDCTYSSTGEAFSAIGECQASLCQSITTLTVRCAVSRSPPQHRLGARHRAAG
tara:strand:- start:1704 stop:1958 length:255 start_codon:yes stop_codon:yes gene_type:complete